MIGAKRPWRIPSPDWHLTWPFTSLISDGGDLWAIEYGPDPVHCCNYIKYACTHTPHADLVFKSQACWDMMSVEWLLHNMSSR